MAEQFAKEQPILMPARMKLREYIQRDFVVIVDPKITQEHLKEPSFWALVAAQFVPMSRLIVYPDDNSFYAEYLVVSCDKNWAKVHELNFKKLTEGANEVLPGEFDIKWRGNHYLHSVIRKSDGAIIRDQFKTRDEADLWLKGYVKAA